MIRVVSKAYFLEHQKYTKLIAKTFVLALILVFLLLPGFLRKENTFIGDKSYYHLKAAEGGFNIYGIAPAWNFILHFIDSKIILFIFGILGSLLLYLNLDKLKLNQRLLAVGLFALSPGFIYMFNVAERYAAAFVISLIIPYFIIKRKYKLMIFPIIILPFFDIQITIFALACIGLYFIYLKKSRSLFYSILVFVSLILAILGNWKSKFISDLGAHVGVSIFALIFILFCFVLFWKELLAFYGIFLVLVLISFNFEFGIFYLSAFMSILISMCIGLVYDMKWESEAIRDYLVLLILCGFLFSALSYSNIISQDKPDEFIFNALSTLPNDSVVFSDMGYGNWIFYSGKKNAWDTFGNTENFKQRKEELESTIDSKDPFVTRPIFLRYGVDYLLIDEDLAEKWDGKGILYLLNNDQKGFKQIYEKDGVKIWRHFK